jgi:hypothetical protein
MDKQATVGQWLEHRESAILCHQAAQRNSEACSLTKWQ